MVRLTYTLLSVIVALIIVSTTPFVLSYESATGTLNQPLGDFTVPSWIKNNAGWWATDLIDDSSFVSGLQWMITNDVILLPPTEQGTGNDENIIPSWIKKTAGWWADDEIHDITFVAAIKYLIVDGIIIIEQEMEEVNEETEEVMQVKDFHMKVNHNDCSHCVAWGYVGEEFHIQIETFDEYNMRHIDGVTIIAKIISKDGELRHDFGIITTEDGIYNDYVIIPSMDWYASNILYVNAEYNGFEKTIEKEFEVFKAKGVSSVNNIAGAGNCALVSPVSVFAQNGKPQAIEFSNNGEKMFVTGNPTTADSIQYYELDGPYCIRTATYVNSLLVESTDNTPTGLEFNSNGMKMYLVGKGGDNVYEYNLTEPFLPQSGSLNYTFSISEDNAPEDIHFNPTGTKMFIVGTENDEVHQYSLSTPYRVSSASHDFSLNINAQESGPGGIAFNPTGTKMFIVGSSKEVNQYDLSTPFVLTSASHSHVFSVSGQEANPRGIAFDNTGTKMFIIGFTGDDVNVYELSVPFVLSSASFVS